MNGNFIRIPRDFREWEWFNKPEMVSLYLYLLLRASRTPKKIFGEEIKRGQVITMRKTLTRELGLTESKLAASLHRLEDSGLITMEKARKYYVISLPEYEAYATGASPQVSQL